MPRRIVSPEPRLLRELRGAVRADLERAGLDGGVVDDAVFCMHEACLNAIQHGQGNVHVRWEVDGGEVRFEVCDRGPGVSVTWAEEPPPADRESGRGLFLIGCLANWLETCAHGSMRCVAFAVGRRRQALAGGQPVAPSSRLPASAPLMRAGPIPSPGRG